MSSEDGAARALPRLLAGLGAVLWLTACSAADGLDPIEVLGGRAAETERIRAEQAETNDPHPSLGSVPEARPRPSSAKQRKIWRSGLVADRSRARYFAGGTTATGVALPPALPPFDAAAPRPARPRVFAAPETPPGPEPAPPTLAAVAPLGPLTMAPVPLTAAPPPAPGTARAERTAARDYVGVIYFAEGSAALDRDDKRVLRGVFRLQRQRGGLLRLVGHSSGRPRAEDALDQRLAAVELSFARARAVAVAMRKLGAREEALALIAAADTAPVYDETAPAGAAGNRRVEIFLEY